MSGDGACAGIWAGWTGSAGTVWGVSAGAGATAAAGTTGAPLSTTSPCPAISIIPVAATESSINRPLSRPRLDDGPNGQQRPG